MTKKIVVWTLCLLAALSVLAGCQSQIPSTGTDTTDSKTCGAIVGQITAINGNQITLALGTLNGRPERPDGEAPNGQAEAGDGADATASATAGDNDASGRPQPPSGDSGLTGSEQPSGDGLGGGMGFTTSGEEMTITITDSTVITLAAWRGMNGAPGSPEDSSSADAANTDKQQTPTAGSLSDLKVGDIISVTLSGDTATAITVEPSGGMSGLGGNRNGGSDSL